MASAASADAGACAAGSMSPALNSSNKPTAPNVNTEAAAATRRDDDNAASSGTMISHAVANDAIPPVAAATIVPSAVRASADSTCAASYRPVHERKYAVRIGMISHAKTSTSSMPGAPRQAM